MHIGFDGRILLGPQRGMARYTRALLKAMTRIAPENLYSVYVDRTIDVEDLPGVVVRQKSRNRAFWASRVLSRIAKSDGVDIMHFPANTCWAWPVCPTVVSLHDINPLLDGSFGWRNRCLYLGYLVIMTYAASSVITGTVTSKNIIERTWPFLKGRIRVIYDGVSLRQVHSQHSDPDTEPDIGRGYLLFVGGCDPNKNLLTLLRAMNNPVLRVHSDFELSVVGVCKDSLYRQRIYAALDDWDLRHRVSLLGWVTDEELVALYRGAIALVFPSFREGFGLPVLEAMTCGTPVIASSTTSVPEVAGNAALLVDPRDAEALARAIARVLTNSELADALRRRGWRRAAEFSWERTARQTLKVYQDVLGIMKSDA